MAGAAAHTPDQNQSKAKIFISYSRKNMAFADKLDAALKERGFEVLIDRNDIYAFDPWWERIQALIGGSDTIVYVLSPDAVKSDVALKEVTYAASLNKRFAPIVCQRVEDRAVPEALRRLNFIFFDDPEQFGASADRLAEALQTDIAWIRRHTEYGETAHRWMEAGRPVGMLLRPPMLDQAEAWLAFRPGGAPAPATETEAFIGASRTAEVAARRRSRVLNATLYTMLVSIILGLLGWINQSYIAEQWHWWTQFRPYVLSAATEQTLKPGDSFKECAEDCPEMIVIPGGSFMMGSNGSSESPQHNITIAKPFAVSKFQLTFAAWDFCVAHNGCNGYPPPDSGWGRGQRPVIWVNWFDAKSYVAWLAKMTGKEYRLISEAEYEYAARAETTTAYPWGDDMGVATIAPVDANCRFCRLPNDNKTLPVGSFPPNRFGLYDMVGNVEQWTEDCWHDNYNGAPRDGSAWTSGNCVMRVLRGGSWNAYRGNLRLAFRNAYLPDYRSNYVGFRVGRTLIVP